MTTDLTTLATLIGLGATVAGLAIAVVRLWMRVGELEESRKQFDAFIGELRKIAKTGEMGVRTLQAGQRQTLAQFGVSQQRIASAEQHQRLMDWANLALAVWDRLRDADDDEE